jgi:hypothetical protein
MIETISILNNAQGGKRISILKTGNFYVDENLKDKCTKVSKGLYIWIPISSIDFISKDKITEEIRPYIISESINGYFIQKNNTWLKPGQYGENTDNGIRAIDTINSYSSGQQDEIVIIDIYITNTPYKLEQEAWHSNPIFKSRKNIDGFGTEKISAPISELRSELKKLTDTKSIEMFNEKNISIDIRNELFNKIKKDLELNRISTYGYLLHMRFAKTGFALQLTHQLGKYDKDLIFILFADDYTVYGSYRDWIEKKKCWDDDIKFIDSGIDDLEKEIYNCKMNGKIPFVKVGSKTTNDKTKCLLNFPSEKKIKFIEEADFGAWTQNNRERSELLETDITILVSGTGIDKASYGRKIDDLFIYDIIDGYLVKNNQHPIWNDVRYVDDYKNFPDVKVYDINFSIPMQNVQNNLSGEDKTSLNKLFRSIENNHEFIISLFKSVLCLPDVKNIDSFSFLNKKQKSFEYKDDIKSNNVSLISLTAGLQNKDLDKLKDLLLSDDIISKNFEIMILNGDVTSREESEKYTRGRLMEFKNSKKSVIILASNMGKRSYSIPEIKNVFLMFDGGSANGTEQVIARGMTEGYQYNGEVKKYFNVISCSINPNRDVMSVIDMFLVNKIANTFNKFKGISTEQSTSIVLGCFPLNLIDEDGIDFNNVDFKEFIKRNPKSQMYIDALIAGIDINILPDDIQSVLEKSGLKSEIMTDLIKNKLELKGLKSKLSKRKEDNKSNKNEKEKVEIERAIKILEALIVLAKSSLAMSFFTNSEGNFSIINTLNQVINDKELSKDFYQEFNIEAEICKFVIEVGSIDENLINASVDEKIIELEYREL